MCECANHTVAGHCNTVSLERLMLVVPRLNRLLRARRVNEFCVPVYFAIADMLARGGRQHSAAPAGLSSDVTPEDGSIVRRCEWKLFSRGINPRNTTNVELREGNTREGQEER